MRLFKNPLLETEASSIYENDLPNHRTEVTAILHTEDKDYYPNNIFSLETLSDYDKLTDNKILTVLLGKSEYRKIILSNRDKFQITVIVNYNGLKLTERYKAIMVSAPVDEMNSESGAGLVGGATEGDLITIEIQCLSVLFSVLKHWTSSGVASNVNVHDVMKGYVSRNMADVKINNKPTEPIVDIVEPDNTRLYNSIIMKDKISILDLPTYIQRKYGVYNGGLGTYVHTVKGKPTISIYPLFISKPSDTRHRLVIYLSDVVGLADLTNKTTIFINNELRIIVSTDSVRLDKGDMADMDSGAGIVSINSNQVLDRTYQVEDGKLKVNSDNMVDKITSDSKNDMKTMKSLGPNDNLYYERSKVVRAKAKILQFQWNYSRVDYLYPGMGVDIVRVKYDKIIREKGTLISHYSKIDNSYLNETTLLNIIVN